MNISITTTPKSISITDSDNNRITVLKTATSLEFHSRLSSNRQSAVMNECANTIKKIVLNPKDNRDNYKVRFDKIAKALTSANVRTLLTAKNALATI